MVSTPLKLSQKYFCIALARSAYYLERGAYIHGKTPVVFLQTVKTMKVSLVLKGQRAGMEAMQFQ